MASNLTPRQLAHLTQLQRAIDVLDELLTTHQAEAANDVTLFNYVEFANVSQFARTLRDHTEQILANLRSHEPAPAVTPPTKTE